MAELNIFRTTVGIAAVLGAIALYSEQLGSLFERERRAAVPTLVDKCKPGFIAMTIDGGPSPSTLSILNGLTSSELKATFHIDPNWIQLASSSTNAKALVEKGHVIGLRFPSSIDPTALSPQDLQAKLQEYAEKIKEFVGVSPKFLRFDYGKTNQQVLETASQMGFIVTTFNIDSQDYDKPNQDIMVVKYQNQWNQVSNGKGSYISVHLDVGLNVYDGEPGAQFFTKVRDAAKLKGYTFTTLNDCFDTSAYMTPQNGTTPGGNVTVIKGTSEPPSAPSPPKPPSGAAKSDASAYGTSAMFSLGIAALAAWIA